MSSHIALELSMAFASLAAKSCLVLLLAWAVNRCIRHQSASARHLIWVTAFGILLLLPFLSFLMPGKQVLVFKVPSVSQHVVAQSPPFGVRDLSKKELDEILRRVQTPSRAIVSSTTNLSTFRKKGSYSAKPTLPSLLEVLLGVWLIGLTVVFFKAIRGLSAIHRYQSKSSATLQVSPSIDLIGLTAQIGIRRKWELRVSTSRIPPTAMTWGVMRPVVLVPKDSDSWTQERLEAVLLHELAHVRRFDSLSQLITLATSALYWFNPLVWLSARAMRAEAETAADDTVLRMGVKPSDYASELLRIAAELDQRRQPYSHIGVSVMKQSKIESRVKAILDPSARRRRGVTMLEAIATMGVAAIVMMPLGALRVGFLQDLPSKPATPCIPAKAAPPAPLSSPAPVPPSAVLSSAPAQAAIPAVPAQTPKAIKAVKLSGSLQLTGPATSVSTEYALLFESALTTQHHLQEDKVRQEKLKAEKAKSDAEKLASKAMAQQGLDAAQKILEAAELTYAKQSSKSSIDMATLRLFQSKLDDEKRNREALALAEALKNVQSVNELGKLKLDAITSLQDKSQGSADDKKRLDEALQILKNQSEQLHGQFVKAQDQIKQARKQLLEQQVILNSLRDQQLKVLQLQSKLRDSHLSARLSELRLRMVEAKGKLSKVNELHSKGFGSSDEFAKAMANFEKAQTAYLQAERAIRAAGKG